MKLVLAFVQPFKLDEVTRRLEQISEFPGMTVGAVRGFGRERSAQPSGSAAVDFEDFDDKVQIQSVVHDEQVDRVIEAIAEVAHTGRYGDGMIFVLPVERSLRIATLRAGEGAL